MGAYLTLLKKAEAEAIVKKSRFIGFAAPVQSAEEALAFLEEIKKEHRGASHHCFAYIIGQNKGIIRYSDDGEPSGTAGKPIVEVMIARDVVDCAVVVTRYFGGVLLGVGGLVRAYAHTASIALDAAGIGAMHETGRWHIQVAYPQWDKVDYAVKSLPIQVELLDYTQYVKLSVLCRTEDEASMLEELRRITDGKIEADREEQSFYHPWGD